MAPKRKLAGNAPISTKRRKQEQVEEISFDFEARQDYLTGFHKRKLQRAKHAQEQASKRAREEKVANRKALREDRKAEVEKHVAEVNAILKDQRGDAEDSTSSGEWEGIQEIEPINYEDRYEDDDKTTTVTVEAVQISRDGLLRISDEDSSGSEEAEDILEQRNEPVAKSSNQPKKHLKKGKPPESKKKKKKFRYESKAERKVTRMKERSGNRAKARSRRG